MSPSITSTPLTYGPHLPRFYRSIERIAATLDTLIIQNRCILLVGSITDWHYLTSDGNFAQWDELHTYLLDQIIACETFITRIHVTEAEARHILAQAKDAGVDIKRGTL